MKIDTYDSAGAKKGTATLNKTVFEAKINPDLMHRSVIMRLANARRPIAHVKTRGEVAATTKKMFRQKGTGNARRGSKVVNLLRGGGVVHGPRNTRNFSKMMPKKERRAALFSSLSVKAKAKELFGWEDFKAKAPKTKDFLKVLEKFPQGKKYLFVLPEKNEVLEKSLSNVPGVKAILVNYLNPFDVLHADQICFFKDSLPKVEEVFLSSK